MTKPVLRRLSSAPTSTRLRFRGVVAAVSAAECDNQAGQLMVPQTGFGLVVTSSGNDRIASAGEMATELLFNDFVSGDRCVFNDLYSRPHACMPSRLCFDADVVD
jgi:hypothetical protein